MTLILVSLTDLDFVAGFVAFLAAAAVGWSFAQAASGLTVVSGQ